MTPSVLPHGILLLDKPSGMTSFDVLRRLRRVLRTKKLGHAGTLDPFASGLLVVCVGDYTRFAGYLTDDSKVYEADVALGVVTNTDDLEGEVLVEQPLPLGWQRELESVLENYRGPISQVPPQFSAIHIDGKRAYALARKGEEVEIPARDVVIESLVLTDVAEDGFRFRVRASKGTYIRALARDIGKDLGCGGHLRGLRRVTSGPFGVEDAWTLEALEAREEGSHVPLILGREALQGMAALVLDEDAVRRAYFGQLSLMPERDLGVYALYDRADQLIGVGEIVDIDDENTGSDRVLRVRRLLPGESSKCLK